jgi:D-glycero-D-manno-heptose 1,7-bisphosphate phosphatase
MKNRAVFIDKDGTLIHDVPYNVALSMISLQPGAREALTKLKEQKYLLIVISNQSGVAHGYFQTQALARVSAKINRLLGHTLDGFYFCPHHPDGSVEEYTRVCECRKPKPGMLIQAAGDFNIDLTSSWMVGDILNDVEAGKHAGCKTILLDNGNETEWNVTELREPDFRVKSWTEIASIILKMNDYASTF